MLLIPTYRAVSRGMPLSSTIISVRFNIFIDSIGDHSNNIENQRTVTAVHM